MATRIQLTAADGHKLSAWKDGPGDGFGCDERASYSATDDRVAQARTLTLFTKHLG
jgi:hypothetical protein